MTNNVPETMGVIYWLQLTVLHLHPHNPFTVRDNPEMLALKESVSKHGVLVPAVARPCSEGGYALIAGHRRKHACELAFINPMPVVAMDITVSLTDEMSEESRFLHHNHPNYFVQPSR